MAMQAEIQHAASTVSLNQCRESHVIAIIFRAAISTQGKDGE